MPWQDYLEWAPGSGAAPPCFMDGTGAVTSSLDKERRCAFLTGLLLRVAAALGWEGAAGPSAGAAGGAGAGLGGGEGGEGGEGEGRLIGGVLPRKVGSSAS